MLFHSSLRKELARSFGATLVVLVTVVMTMTLIRTLGQASRGRFDPADVTLVMGYTVLTYLPTLLAMGLFIAVMATLSRMYRDSEMVIWFTAGRGLVAFVRPLMRFSWPIFVAIGVLSTLVLPWSNLRVAELRQGYEARGDLERIEPGQFQESASGSRVFFIDKTAPDAKVGTNVFITSSEGTRQTVTSARSGQIEQTASGRFLILEKGQRLETDSRHQSLKLSEFAQHGTRVSDATINRAQNLAFDTVPSIELLRINSPAAHAELTWRLGLLLAAFNLVLIATALAKGNPRAARSAHILFAIFVFVIYYNLLSLGQSWVASGKYTAIPLMLSLHGSATALAVLWLARAHWNWYWPVTSKKQAAPADVAVEGTV